MANTAVTKLAIEFKTLVSRQNSAAAALSTASPAEVQKHSAKLRDGISELDTQLAAAFVTIEDGTRMFADQHQALGRLGKANKIGLGRILENITLDEYGSVSTAKFEDLRLKDIEAISELTQLQELWLGDSPVKSLVPVGQLTDLRLLWASGKQISDLSPLASLTKLSELHLDHNRISDITALATLTSLDELWLRGNHIKYLAPLAELSTLNRLELTNNAISDVSALAALINLEFLFLDNDQICDIAPLRTLPNLKELELSDNPLNAASKKIAGNLKKRGIKVNV